MTMNLVVDWDIVRTLVEFPCPGTEKALETWKNIRALWDDCYKHNDNSDLVKDVLEYVKEKDISEIVIYGMIDRSRGEELLSVLRNQKIDAYYHQSILLNDH